MKAKRFILMLLVTLLATANTAWADSQTSTRQLVNIDQSIDAGYTLQPGKMYIVRSTMEITATTGNGLNVDAGSGQAPILYIPADVTLTVKGADAAGLTPGGAGIFVPSGAQLIITGAGTLIAKGGDAANGGNGENGHNGGDKVATKDGKIKTSEVGLLDHSGAGGAGGNGGGGAGAGIGGYGGAGGQGGLGGMQQTFSPTETKNGQDGSKGGNGSTGAGMGKVYLMGSVTVNATSGNVGTAGGTGGKQGYSLYDDYNGYWNVAGAGGGGAGGGAGFAAAYGIGAGGRGAGGGAGGGSGSADYASNLAISEPSQYTSYGHASSATGVGSGSVSGEAGTNNVMKRDDGAFGLGIYRRVGGNGSTANSAAGTEATTAENGYLYVGDNVTLNGAAKGTYPADYKGSQETHAPADMTITLTFKNGSTEIGQLTAVIGNALPAAAVSTYKLSGDPGEYFAGYYTAENGLGNRIYKGISSDNINLDVVADAVTFSEDATIFAHFSHNKHSVAWDYTYQQVDGDTYTDIPEGIRVKRARLTFYYRNGESESRILTAADVTRAQDSSPAADSHLTTTSAITLVSSGSETLSGNDIVINIDDDKLSQFTSYTFEALNNDAETVPTNWLVYTNASEHTSTISFTGAEPDNCFDLQWSVTLGGLKVYPEVIFVKPMYEENGDYQVISQLADEGNRHYDGVQCAWTAKPADDAESCTYTGSYPVWKFKDGENSYNYKIGLVGFILGGQKYYMDATPGNVHSDMVSPDEHNGENNICIYSGSAASCIVMMNMPASAIPVLRLMPNGGTLSATTPAIVVNNERSGQYDLSLYSAENPGYVQIGWSTEPNGGTHYALDAKIDRGTAALTLYAEWLEIIKPVINNKEILYNQNGATIVVTVTDNVSTPEDGLYVFALVSDTEVANPDNSSEWTEVTSRDGNDYLISIINKSWAWIYVKAEDAAGNTEYQSSTSAVKVDGLAPTYEISSDGIACNSDVEIIAKDNIKLSALYVKKASAAEWGEAVAWTGETDVDKTFTLTKPTAEGEANGEGAYSLKLVDGAGNETVYEDFVTLFYDHKYEMKSNETGHWMECINGEGTCNAEIKDEEEHCTPNLLDDKSNYHCDVCGYTNESLKAEYDARDYMSMKAVGGDVVVGFKKSGNPDNYTIQVSEDGNIWSEPKELSEAENELATIPEGQTYYFRHGAQEATNHISSGDNSYWSFTLEGNGTIEADGNIMSLLDATCKQTELPMMPQHVFTKLFLGCEKLIAAPRMDAITSVPQWGFVSMFSGTGITAAPVLSTTYIRDGAYRAMFENCKELLTVPTLPATTLNRCAYWDMFKGCDKLSSIEIANIESMVVEEGSTGRENSFHDMLAGTAVETNGVIIAPVAMMGDARIALPSNWQWATKLKLNEDPNNEGNFYTTFYDSRYDYAVEDGFKAYSGTITSSTEGNLLRLAATRQNIIPKSDGVVIHGGSDEVLLTVSNGDTQNVPDNLLTGSDSDITAPAYCYILSYGSQGFGFYKYSKTIPAHKAYLQLSAENQAKAFRMVFDGEMPTGIINVNEDTDNNKSIYNLNGIRIIKLQKGVNIVNGKKIFIK